MRLIYALRRLPVETQNKLIVLLCVLLALLYWLVFDATGLADDTAAAEEIPAEETVCLDSTDNVYPFGI